MKPYDFPSNITKQVFDFYVKSLGSIYDEQEAESISLMVFEHLMGLKRIQVLTEHSLINQSDIIILSDFLNQLMKHEPVQYVLGETSFYNLQFIVNQNVLIPRPETEELVDLILKDHKAMDQVIRVADIGTGSGCIPIALKRNRELWLLDGFDISKGALEVARTNAYLNYAEVNFQEEDLFQFNSANYLNAFDIIVSNPPYVLDSEKADMETRVKDFEPAVALFVKDCDPLIYYHQIILLSEKILKPGGQLYFEINPKYAQQLVNVLSIAKFENIEVIKDMHGKERMIKANHHL